MKAQSGQEAAAQRAALVSTASSFTQMTVDPLSYFASELVPLPQLVAASGVLAGSGLVDGRADRWEVIRLAAEVLECANRAQIECYPSSPREGANPACEN